MRMWSNSLLAKVEEQLNGHEYWGPRANILSQTPGRANSLHLAIFVEPFLTFVLDGRKTIESRFSIHRRPPFGCVRSGDLVLIKRSGGPIVALAEVSQVWYYELDSEAWDFIRRKFSKQLCIDDPGFWESKSSAYFATLMRFAHIEKLAEILCSKRDRRGWVVLRHLGEQRLLFPDVHQGISL
jgi:hypothetical protein